MKKLEVWGLLIPSQKPTIEPYPEQIQSCLYLHNLFSKIDFGIVLWSTHVTEWDGVVVMP